MKEKLDYLCNKYQTKDFIAADPIKFPHKYQEKIDIEISAFIRFFTIFSTYCGLVESK